MKIKDKIAFYFDLSEMKKLYFCKYNRHLELRELKQLNDELIETVMNLFYEKYISLVNLSLKDKKDYFSSDKHRLSVYTSLYLHNFSSNYSAISSYLKKKLSIFNKEGNILVFNHKKYDLEKGWILFLTLKGV